MEPAITNRVVSIEIRGENAQFLTSIGQVVQALANMGAAAAQSAAAASAALNAMQTSAQQAGVALTKAGQEGAQAMTLAQFAAKQAADAAEQQAQRWDRLKQSISEFREIMGGLGLAIVAAIGISVKEFAAFEQAMNQSRAMAGLTDAAYHQMSANILAVAPALGRAPKELAEGLYFVISAGFQASEAMGILTAATKAAAAEHSNLSVVGEGLTSVMKAYNLQASEAEHVTDQMIVAVVEGKLEFANLSGSIGRVAAISHVAGLSIGEMLGSLTIMTRAGLSAEEAATALRATLNNLEKPSKQATGALAELGYTTDSLRQSIKDRGLTQTLQDLMEKTGGNLDVIGKIIPNIRALTGVLSAASGGWEEYHRVVQAVENAHGQTAAAFANTNETLSQSFLRMKATIESAAIAIGTNFAPQVHEAANAVQALLERFIAWLQSDPEMVKSVEHAVALAGALMLLAGGAQALQAAVYLVGVSFGPMFVGLKSANLLLKDVLSSVMPAAAAFIALKFAIDQDIPVLSGLATKLAALPDDLKITAAAILGVVLVAPRLVESLTAITGQLALLAPKIAEAVAMTRTFGIEGGMVALGLNPWVLALIAATAAVVAFDRVLHSITGEGLIERFVGTVPQAVVDAMTERLDRLKQALDQVNSSASASINDAPMKQLEGSLATLTFAMEGYAKAHEKAAAAQASNATNGFWALSIMDRLTGASHDAADAHALLGKQTDTTSAAIKLFGETAKASSDKIPLAKLEEWATQLSEVKKKYPELAGAVDKALGDIGAAIAKGTASAGQDLTFFNDTWNKVAHPDKATGFAEAFADMKTQLGVLIGVAKAADDAIKNIGKEPPRELAVWNAALALSNEIWKEVPESVNAAGVKIAAHREILQGISPVEDEWIRRTYGALVAQGKLAGGLTDTSKILDAMATEAPKQIEYIDLNTKATTARNLAENQTGPTLAQSLAAYDHQGSILRKNTLDQTSYGKEVDSARLTLALQTGELTRGEYATEQAALKVRDLGAQYNNGKISAGDFAKGIADTRSDLEKQLSSINYSESALGKHATAAAGAARQERALKDESGPAIEGMGALGRAADTASDLTKASGDKIAAAADEISTKLPEAGTVAGEGFGGNLMPKLQATVDNSSLVLGSLGNEVDLRPTGDKLGESLKSGIDPKITAALASVNDLLKQMGLDAGNVIRSNGEALGLDLTGGATAGIVAGQQPLINQVAATFQAAVDAARAVVDSHSDSVVFMEIAHDMIGGWKTGWSKEELDLAAAVTSTFTGILSAIDQTVSVLPHLLDVKMTEPMRAGMQELVGVMQEAIEAVLDSGSHSKEALDAATATASTASGIFSAMSAAIGFMEAIAKMRAPMRDYTAEIEALSTLIGEAINALLAATTELSQFSAEKAGATADAAGKVFSAFQTVIGFITAIATLRSEVTGHSQQMTELATDMREAIDAMTAAMTDISANDATKAAEAADAAGKVTTAMTQIVTLVQALATLAAPLTIDPGVFNQLGDNIKLAFEAVRDAGADFSQIDMAQVTDAAAASGAAVDAMTKIIGLVTALATLMTSVTIDPSTFNLLGDDIKLAFEAVRDASADFAELDMAQVTKGGAAAGAAIDAMTKIVALVTTLSTMIAPLTISPTTFNQLGDNVKLAFEAVRDASADFAELDMSRVTKAGAAANAAIDAMSKVLDFVAKLAAATGTMAVDPATLNQLGANINLAVRAVRDATEGLSELDMTAATKASAAASAVFDGITKLVEIVGKLRSMPKLDATDAAGLADALSKAVAVLRQAIVAMDQDLALSTTLIGPATKAMGEVFAALASIVDTLIKVRSLRHAIDPQDAVDLAAAMQAGIGALAAALADLDAKTREAAVQAGPAAANIKLIFEALKAVMDVITQAKGSLAPALVKETLKALVRDAIEVFQVFVSMAPELTATQQRIATTTLPAIKELFDTVKAVLDVFLMFSETTTQQQKNVNDHAVSNSILGTASTEHAESEITKQFHFNIADRLRAELPSIEATIKAAINIAMDIVRMWQDAIDANFKPAALEATAAMSSDIKQVIGALKDTLDLLKDLGTGVDIDPNAATNALSDKVRAAHQAFTDAMEIEQPHSDGKLSNDPSANQQADAALIAWQNNRTKAQRTLDQALAQAQREFERAQQDNERKLKEGDPKIKIMKGIDTLKEILDATLKALETAVKDFNTRLGEFLPELDKMFTAFERLLGTLRSLVDLLTQLGDGKQLDQIAAAKKFFLAVPDLLTALIDMLKAILDHADDLSDDNLDKASGAFTRGVAAAALLATTLRSLSDTITTSSGVLAGLPALVNGWGSAAISVMVGLEGWAKSIATEADNAKSEFEAATTEILAALAACVAMQDALAQLAACSGHALGGIVDPSAGSGAGGMSPPNPGSAFVGGGDLPPHYANGSIVFGPHVGVFGEDGAEALLPLTKPAQFWGIMNELSSRNLIPNAPSGTALPNLGRTGSSGGGGGIAIQRQGAAGQVGGEGGNFIFNQTLHGTNVTAADVKREVHNGMYVAGVTLTRGGW